MTDTKSPTQQFVSLWHSAYENLPDALGTPEAQAQLDVLTDWMRRNVAAHEAYRRGEVPREKLQPYVRGRGTAEALVDETPSESKALMKLLSMSARVVASCAKKCELPIEEALGEAPSVFIRSMRGYQRDRGRLLPYLTQDLGGQFRHLTRRRGDQKVFNAEVDVRATPQTHVSFTGRLLGRFDTEKVAESIIAGDSDLLRLWNEYLTPTREEG